MMTHPGVPAGFVPRGPGRFYTLHGASARRAAWLATGPSLPPRPAHVADELAFLHDGQIIAQGSAEALERSEQRGAHHRRRSERPLQVESLGASALLLLFWYVHILRIYNPARRKTQASQ